MEPRPQAASLMSCFISMVCLIKRRARSMKASLSARQLSRSTPTPRCPVTSAIAISATYSATRRCIRWLALISTKSAFAAGSLDLGELAPEVLDEDLLQASSERNGFLADEFEAPVQRTEDLLLEKGTRLQSFLDVWVLRDFAQFLIDLCRFLSALPDVAQHFDEKFFGIIYGHWNFPF